MLSMGMPSGGGTSFRVQKQTEPNQKVNITFFRKTGALGFEPRNSGTKTRCLTTWPRPNGLTFFNIAVTTGVMSSTLTKNLGQMLKIFPPTAST